MAKSNNKRKRKGGKVVKSDLVKRTLTRAGYDLKNLIVCSVVDMVELKDENRNKMIPRTITFDRRLKKIVGITRLQEVALKTERWQWNIHSGVICRKQDGQVYIDKEENIWVKTAVKLTELNDYIADTLADNFNKANPMHALTMFWVATPYDMGDVPLEAVLAPIWKYDVLANMLTQYEREYKDKQLIYYKASTLDVFVDWFLNQNKHQSDLKINRQVEIEFVSTGDKMKKGELIDFRSKLLALEFIDDYNPKATVKGFSETILTLYINGYEQATLVSLLEKTPNCLKTIVSYRLDLEDCEWKYVVYERGQIKYER